MPDYLDTIISYICQNTFDDLSQGVILRAKEVLSDSLGVIAAGSQEEEVKGFPVDDMVNSESWGTLNEKMDAGYGKAIRLGSA